MDAGAGREPGHYRALGVPARSSQKQIEVAFEHWRRERRAGRVGAESFRRAELAYHALADPPGRRRHDRQLGLLGHPAWRDGDPGAARRLARRGLAALARGRAAEAARLLAAAAARGEGASAAWLPLAELRAGGCPNESARQAAAAVKRFPDDAALRFALAEALRAAGGAASAKREERRGWALIVRATLRAALPGRAVGGGAPPGSRVTALTDRRRSRG